MSSKQLVQQFLDNLFVDNEKAYATLADNVEFYWPGYSQQPIRGKQAIIDFLAQGGPEKVVEQQVIDIWEHDNHVVGHGSMTTIRQGKTESSHFADFYTITAGKISHVRSYMVMDHANSNPS
ncbi:MAG: nuclear transport factor 2 family protein [Weeksellaceae bacterium]|nr:nuclear transport factor 2 family protein [Weeksellaceae bacterium]